MSDWYSSRPVLQKVAVEKEAGDCKVQSSGKLFYFRLPFLLPLVVVPYVHCVNKPLDAN